MKQFLIATLLVCSLVAYAQFDFTDQPFLSGGMVSSEGYSDPAGDAGISHWWVFNDITNVSVGQVISFWQDRVSGLILTNDSSVTRPTLRSDGVEFDGGDSLYSLSPLTRTNKEAFVFVGSVTANAANHYVFDFSDHLDAFFTYNWGGDWRTFGSGILTAVSDRREEIIYAGGADMRFYTNGIYTGRAANDTGDGTHGVYSNMFRSFTGGETFLGKVKELIIYTNVSGLTSGQISNVHYYVTNTYGAPP